MPDVPSKSSASVEDESRTSRAAELQPGFRSTEFWLTLFVVALEVAAALDKILPAEWAYTLIAVQAAIYKGLRIYLKARALGGVLLPTADAAPHTPRTADGMRSGEREGGSVLGDLCEWCLRLVGAVMAGSVAIACFAVAGWVAWESYFFTAAYWTAGGDLEMLVIALVAGGIFTVCAWNILTAPGGGDR
jgi:hypothetical protein